MEILSAPQVREASMDRLVEEAKKQIMSEINRVAPRFIDGGVFILQKNLRQVYPDKVVQELSRIFNDQGWNITFSVTSIENRWGSCSPTHSVIISEVT